MSNLNPGILDGLRRTGLRLRKLVIQSASGIALVISRDGSTTTPGAMWFTPGAGHAAALSMLNQTSGVTFALMPEVANAPGGVSALGGFGGAWVVAGATSGLAVSIFQVANSDGTQELRIQDNGVVDTQYNTLDDGSGNAAVAGALTVGSGVADAEQFTALSSSYTLTASGSAQKLFNATTNGALTVAASTSYFFECVLSITGLSSSSHTIDFGFGGTATFTSAAYEALTATAAGGAASLFSVSAATATAVTAAGTGTVLQAAIKGVIRVNGGGTVIPQITQVTANAAAAVGANSYFRAWPVGSDTIASAGNWS